MGEGSALAHALTMLQPGAHLAHYEILESIGKGGTGEVHRARDTKLKREVAIKVLPEEFARDKERLARFERKAQLLASLNHPNIASIYGIEDADGVKAPVLELVEGPYALNVRSDDVAPDGRFLMLKTGTEQALKTSS